MNPAFSVIFLTTLIGAGQGLFAAIVLGQPHFVDIATAGFTVADTMSSFVFLGCGISFLLMMMGLIASFFHLGHPERAWRAVFQWKTSWLSREVIVMPLVMGVVVVYGAFHLFDAAVIKQQVGFDLVSLMGWVGFILVMILYLCTAMIYACIRFIQEWSSPLTVINYTVLGLMSGFVLASALSFQTEPQRFELYFILALSLLVVGLITRSLSLYRNGRIKPKSTMETAIGIKHRLITQRSQGSMGGSFNTRDFFHHCAEGVIVRIKWTVILSVFLLPGVILVVGWLTQSGLALWLAFVVQYLGLLGERWLFFAQANHPQNLYYQTVS